jgi:hypothetical protein
MDSMTYAAVAVLPESIAQNEKPPFVPEAEFNPFNLSYITR